MIQEQGWLITIKQISFDQSLRGGQFESERKEILDSPGSWNPTMTPLIGK